MEIIEGKDLMNMKFIKTDDGLLKEYKPQGRFIPKLNQTYFFINSDGYVDSYTNTKHKADNYIIAHNLVFRTQDECEDYKWFLDMLDEYRTDFSKEEWENVKIIKCYLYFEHANQGLATSLNYTQQQQGIVYFTRKNIEKFIEEVGEDRIKKYLFDVWE